MAVERPIACREAARHDSTATAGSDYTTTAGTLNFPTGSTSANITVVINGDTAIEADETITLNFTAPVGVAIGTASATGTLTNDDNADPAGYYTGTGTVKQPDNSTNLVLSDLQALVYGNRIMLMSVSQLLLYDMQSIVISGNSYTAVLTLYQNAAYVATVNVSGTLNEGVSLTGTLTGSGAGNGSFTVAYNATVNAKTASLVVIGNVNYDGKLNNGISAISFDVANNGNVTNTTVFSDAGKMSGCNFNTGSSLLPQAASNLYVATFVLTGCTDTNVNGSYTGLSTTFDNVLEGVSDGYMPTAFSNGTYSGTADFKKN